MKLLTTLLVSLLLVSCSNIKQTSEKKSYSGIYPHLAFYNGQGECGTGAVVPWQGSLWAITYSPHFPQGSDDKLYEITPGLDLVIYEESVGGTPANRMIHKESEQLFIGPYAIDKNKNVRAIPYEVMYGRHTGNARHLTDPENKVYYGTMEEGFYEVDVNDLSVNTLYTDGNLLRKKGELVQAGPLLEGAHGKGLYSSQGVMVYSNNGAANYKAMRDFDAKSGALYEWDGKDWTLVRRNQFVEVTGPGGIYGNENPGTDPIWATGWDYKSILLGVRNAETGWDFYRLPKASHSYDGAHGWNTEWPRIRDIGTPENPDYLMTMHGMFWRFPDSFTAENSAGIRPRSAYLKVIGDFTRFNDGLVFGCDDSANKEFLNKRKAKGKLEGPGQSNSNLWFTSLEKPDQLGPATAEGAVWLMEEVKADIPSEPFLFAGWDSRSCWIKSDGKTATFLFEVDTKGNGGWDALRSVRVNAGETEFVSFGDSETGEWVRVSSDVDTKATVHFSYTSADPRPTEFDAMFTGISTISETNTSAGVLWGLGDNRRALGVVAGNATDEGFEEFGYYELDANMNLVKKEDAETSEHISKRMGIPQDVVTIDEASVLVVDDKGRRWRLPKGNEKYKQLTDNGLLRICREVATERDLFNCAGTFYELPAENADGYAKIRPVASHDFRIYDYASYRGLLVMTGLEKNVAAGEHIIKSDDGEMALWVGAIDDLWKMGKPTGQGGPWKETEVKAGESSDAYLIGFYDQKSLVLSHDAPKDVTFKIQVEPIGHGPWMTYKEVTVKSGETFEYKFSEGFQSRWVRFVSDADCKATAWLEYK